MVAAKSKSSPGFDEEEVYEKIEAPKWVDFTTPEKSQPDDYAWFCLRAGCKQNHDEALDPAVLSANFLRRVMEARSPNVRMGKDSRLLTPKAIAKCPLSAPVKTAKSRIPRLHDNSRKRMQVRVVRKLVSATGDAVSSPHQVRSAKAVTTPSHKKSQNNSGAFRSVRSSKVVISVKGHLRPVAKALVFHSPKKTSKPSKEKNVTPSRIHTQAKKLEAGSGNLAVGRQCKSSRCAVNDPSYNMPVSVPSRTCKQQEQQRQKAIFLNPNNPRVSMDVSKHDQNTHQQAHLFDDERIVDEKSLETEEKTGVQRSSDERSCGSIEMEIDGNSRHASLEVCAEMKCSVNRESKECAEKHSIAALAYGESDISNKGHAEGPSNTTTTDLVKHDFAVHGNESDNDRAELQTPIKGVKATNCSETRDTNHLHDLPSEAREFVVTHENDKPNQEPAVTLRAEQPQCNETSLVDNAAAKPHHQVDQTIKGRPLDEEITGIGSMMDTGKEKTCGKDLNEKRKGMKINLNESKRSAKKLTQPPNPCQDLERKDLSNKMSKKTIDDFDNAENANKENTSTSANSNLSSVNHSGKRLGKKIAYEIPKKSLEIPQEKVHQGSVSTPKMDRKTTKLTNPKPFRLRTNERGILREANLEKRQHVPEISIDTQKKQNNLMQQGKHHSQIDGNASGRMMHNESNTKVVKSRYLASRKPRQPKMEVTTQQPQKMEGKDYQTQNVAEQAKDQKIEMPQMQYHPNREVKPRKKWSTSALREQDNCYVNGGLVLPKQHKVENFETSTESPCTKDRSCSRGKRHLTTPKAPHFHNIHTPKTCCAKKSANEKL